MKKFAAAAVLSMVLAVPAFAMHHRLKHPKTVHPQQQRHYVKRPKAIHPRQRRPSTKHPKAIHAQNPYLMHPVKHPSGRPRKHHLHLWPFHKKR
jgi:hypothetical protein